MPYPLLSHLLLLSPATIERRLAEVRASGRFATTPNVWQVTLGAARMWHRIVFRSQTIGTGAAPVRATLRARILHHRLARFPCLLAEQAIAPWDLSGLLSSQARVFRHLLGAHHEGDQFTYDLEMLSIVPGALQEVRAAAAAVVDGSSPRTEWLRDLCVFAGYHENLVAALDRAIAAQGQPSVSDNPDISFDAYLRWCARQPATPAETRALLLQRRYSIANGTDRALAVPG